jgi:hypothetical protein
MAADTGEPFWQPRGTVGNRGAVAALILRWNRLTLLENNRPLLISFRQHPVNQRNQPRLNPVDLPTEMCALKNYQRYAMRCLEAARTAPDSPQRSFFIEMAEAWRRLAEQRTSAQGGQDDIRISEPDRGD